MPKIAQDGGPLSKMPKSTWNLSAACCIGLCFSASALADSLQAAVPKVADNVKNGLAAAESYYTQQQYAQAEAELHALLLQTPRNDSANELLGLVLTSEGRDADATPFFENAVRMSPASVPARENLAANYAKRNKNMLAEMEFKTLVRLDPKNFDLQHNCGEFYINLGKIAEAVVPLKAAQQLRPTDYSNGYDLSLAEMMSGRLVEAETQVQSLLALTETSELHSVLAEVYEKQNKFLLAAKEYQRAAQMDPTEGSVFDSKGATLCTLDKLFSCGIRVSEPRAHRACSIRVARWNWQGGGRAHVHNMSRTECGNRAKDDEATLGRSGRRHGFAWRGGLRRGCQAGRRVSLQEFCQEQTSGRQRGTRRRAGEQRRCGSIAFYSSCRNE
jgi:Tfp pilus assembly protein PilF